ncbi:MAG: amino acid racemase [Pseudomonadota bacterium]
MKTLGLIGGMSWESSAVYYQLLNLGVRERLGGLHSSKLLLWSFDFHEIEAYQAAGDWRGAGALLADAATRLAAAGADAIVIATNTMHCVYAEVAAAVAVPVLHIADPTGDAIRAAGVSRPLLLGTRFTMEQDFYTGRLKDKYGIDVLVPGEQDRTRVHGVIYDELVQGVIEPTSKADYLKVVASAILKGADSVIFGCTEIGLLIEQADLSVPAFDTAQLHVEAALALQLAAPPPAETV